VVKGLLAASQTCRRHRLAEHTVALTVAVAGALDLALNRGKGKVLERWLEETADDVKTKPIQPRPRMSDRAFSFFTAMPRRNPRGKPRI